MISDSAMWNLNVYKTLSTNQTNQSKTTDSAHMATTSSAPSSCPLPTSCPPTGHRRLLAFPVCDRGIIIVKTTPLASQVGNLVLIPVFNVFSSVLSMVLFLRASCCFPDWTCSDMIIWRQIRILSRRCACCMPNANIASRPLFGLFHVWVEGFPITIWKCR